MKVTINFDTKNIEIIGRVNLQDLIVKLSELGLNLGEYTIGQEVTFNTYPTSPNWGTLIGSPTAINAGPDVGNNVMYF